MVRGTETATIGEDCNILLLFVGTGDSIYLRAAFYCLPQCSLTRIGDQNESIQFVLFRLLPRFNQEDCNFREEQQPVVVIAINSRFYARKRKHKKYMIESYFSCLV